MDSDDIPKTGSQSRLVRVWAAVRRNASDCQPQLEEVLLHDVAFSGYELLHVPGNIHVSTGKPTNLTN